MFANERGKRKETCIYYEEDSENYPMSCESYQHCEGCWWRRRALFYRNDSKENKNAEERA